MKRRKVISLYWSATGNTKKVTETIGIAMAKELDCPWEAIDITSPQARVRRYVFSRDDIVVVASPTYAGKLPNKILPDFKEKIQGTNTPVIGVVTYGNRSFDHALAELCGVLKENDCIVFGAAAVVCEHAFSKNLATGRPTDTELKELQQWGTAMAKKLLTDLEWTEPSVPGDKEAPYYVPLLEDGTPAKFLKAEPVTDIQKCTACGTCARVCPMGSIDEHSPQTVNGVCIKCQACIQQCPSGAKSFKDEAFLSHVKMLETHYTGQQNNIFFS